MEVIKNLFSLRAPPPPNDLAAAAAPSGGPRSLQSQFEAQTARLREIQRAQRPKNTQRAYEPKPKQWGEWRAGLADNTDGAWVTEDKLCLFLEQEVVNHESRAPGYEARKAKWRAMWEDGERAKRRGRGIKRPWTACSTKRSDFRSSTATFPPSLSCTHGNPKAASPRRRCRAQWR